MPRLIVLNGPPGCGKSTLAQMYVDHHPFALNLDIDRVRALIGGWRSDAHQGGVLARAIAHSAAHVHLGGGHDVIVPQFVGRAEFLEQLERLARDTGADFHEVVLLADKDELRSRFIARTRHAQDPVHLDAQHLVDAGGGLAQLSVMYDRLVTLLPSRPRAQIVPVTEGRVDDTYQALLRAVTG